MKLAYGRAGRANGRSLRREALISFDERRATGFDAAARIIRW